MQLHYIFIYKVILNCEITDIQIYLSVNMFSAMLNCEDFMKGGQLFTNIFLKIFLWLVVALNRTLFDHQVN